MVGERRAAARAVRDDFIALVEQAFVPDLAQQPPNRFDVGIGVGHVRAAQVHPIGDPFSQLLPFLDARKGRFAAEGIELFDAVFLDLAFLGETELLFNFDLNRKSVRVPTTASIDEVTLHRAEAWEHVLESPGQHVVYAGFAIGSWGTLEHHKRFAVAAFV